MSTADRIRVLGTASLPVQPEIPGPLDELIYRASSAALEASGIGIADIDGVCMAASDVLDGRGISTMTLTGSTGSFRKSELRVCGDGLAAIGMAVAEMLSGAHDHMLVCSWSKLSDTDPAAIAPLALEPAFHRPLGLNPDVLFQLRESHTRGEPTITAASDRWPADTAVGVVLRAERSDAVSEGPQIVGYGSSMGGYLRPGADVTTPLSAAVRRAVVAAGRGPDEIVHAYVAGMEQLDDARIRAALTLDGQPVTHLEPLGADVGYAAGLLAFVEAARDGADGLVLVASVSGVGMQVANALLMEV